MDTPATSSGQDTSRYVSVGEEEGDTAFCKCGEGWACVVTKTQEPEPAPAPPFFKCAEKCACSIESKREGDSKTYSLRSPGAGTAVCRVGEGYRCIITKTTGPDAGKTFVDCGGSCTCVINGP